MNYGELAASIAREHGLDPEIFVRQMMQESGLNPDAVSPKGAVGIAQIMPDTARDPGFGITPISDPRDPEEALRFGAQYMRAMLNRYDGDYGLALAAYNAGPGAVDEAGGIPAFRETQNYVSNILGGAMQPDVPGGLSMGVPGTMPSEELMFGMPEDAGQDAVIESILGRFQPKNQAEQAAALSRFSAINAQGPGNAAQAQETGIFSLPEARSTPTAVERLRELG
jgi:hypothetical protein